MYSCLTQSIQTLYMCDVHVAVACRRTVQTSGFWVVHSDLVLQGEVCVHWNPKGVAKCLVSSQTKRIRDKRSCQENSDSW